MLYAASWRLYSSYSRCCWQSGQLSHFQGCQIHNLTPAIKKHDFQGRQIHNLAPTIKNMILRINTLNLSIIIARFVKHRMLKL